VSLLVRALNNQNINGNRNKQQQRRRHGLIFRAAHDLYYKQLLSEEIPKKKTPIGRCNNNNNNSEAIALADEWESCCLTVLSDCIIHVSPLASGFSKEAHGRISIITTRNQSVVYEVINYCCLDSSVRAFRIKT